MVANACMGWRRSLASTAFLKNARRYAQVRNARTHTHTATPPRVVWRR